MSDSVFLKGVLEVLHEILEGGAPGQGTSVLDRTSEDGTGNAGLFATLDRLDAPRASLPALPSTSVAAHAAHTAYYFEVALLWAIGNPPKSDWPGSFEPRVVDEAKWRATRDRLRTSYEELVAHAKGRAQWDDDSAGGLAAALAHTAYHLGAIRQLTKR